MMDYNAPKRGFSSAEFEARTNRAQALLAQQDLAGMLLTTEPEIRYFTGFRTLFWQSPTRPWFLFVPVSGKPIAIIPEIGAALMRQSWIEDIRTWSAPTPSDDGISLLTELLTPILSAKGRIGIPKGHETYIRMPMGDWERLIANLGGVQFQDVTQIVQGLRMVKTPAEIEKLSYICKLGSETFAQVPNFVSIGQPLEETFRAFKREALSRGVDDVPYLVGAADQGGYIDVISPPSRRPLQTGDILMMDTGCTWDGYFCDFDRNWAIGQADDLARKAYDVLWRATEAGITAAKSGNTCQDLFHAMSDVIKELDDTGGDIGRLGHGLGMQLTEQPSHAAFDTTLLQENMVLTLEPSLSYGNGLMMVHEENIVVSKDGGQLLTTRAESDLPTI